MRDEPKNYHHHQPPWRPEMPHISIPTQTIPINVRPGVQSPSLTTVSLPGTTGFVLGADTCGFTTSSTITCDSGYECNNVGNYRGCCSPGDENCVSTIYTDCIDYDDAGYSADCGVHTLCCPQTNPFCFTYAYMTVEEPGTTFKHVQCNPSNGFGEMFPFPPELMATTSSPLETHSSDDDTSSHSTPTGAIVGAVVGSVVFVILVVIAAVLIFRNRRRSRQRAELNAQAAQSGPAKTPQSSADVSPASEKEQAQAAAAAAAAANKKRSRRSLLRPLSLIREQPSPVAPAATAAAAPNREKHKTVAVGSAARRSFGPNWPLGTSTGNPLGAHPIDADLKKRLSDSRLGARIQDNGGVGIGMGIGDGGGGGGSGSGSSSRQIPSHQTTRVPILQLPTPPPPGTKPAKPLPLPLTPRRSGSGSGSTPTSATAALQSPRLSYVPVSPIEAVAFGGSSTDRGVNRPVSRALDPINGDHNTTTDAAAAAAATAAATAAGPRSTVQQTAEPVSPIESDADGNPEGGQGEIDEDAQRLSYVSAPSAPGEADRDLVSPVSPDEAGSDEEERMGRSGSIGRRLALGPISPLDSRPRTMGL
ncbi:hypothetical protein Hte_001066 [Hypoxylon texense]